MRIDRTLAFPLAAILVCFAPRVLAHAQIGEATGFLTGFLHPISGLDHVLAMVAVGVWGAQLGAPAIWLLPVTFPIVTVTGGLLTAEALPLKASSTTTPSPIWPLVKLKGKAIEKS